MPPPRLSLSTAVVNGKIYAIGGIWGGVELSTEGYDPVTDTWTEKADMPTPRHDLSTSVVDGKIYAIGGTKTTSGNNPATGRWTKGFNMPTSRGWLSTSAVKGKIYAIDGSQGEPDWVPLSTVEEFDTADYYRIVSNQHEFCS